MWGLKGEQMELKNTGLQLKQRSYRVINPRILPYRGYGNEKEAFISGIVIEYKALSKPQKENIFRNIGATLRRFSGKGIPCSKVKALFLGETLITEIDEYGFFNFRFNVSGRFSRLEVKDWHIVNFELTGKVSAGHNKV
jgi:hypothetical protein